MKIGILTYHRAYNYGAFLQAFALKSFLEEIGHQVSFVDYWPYDHENLYSLWDKTDNQKSFFRNLILALKRSLRHKRFLTAQQHYLGINRTPVFRSVEQLDNLDYDVIVYGSDQIWWKSRIEENGFDPVYWGQHVNSRIKKVSYAASMGVINLTDNDLTVIKNYLTAFSHISVRETQLMNILQPLTNKAISTVLDPTLLLPSSFWESLCEKEIRNHPKYILFYHVMSDDKADRFAQEISNKLNLPVIKILGHISSYKVDQTNISTDPIRFINLIRNAEYVISTSFHGVAMSIQFKKEFYAMGMHNNSDRVSSLLTQLGLENRMTDTVPSLLSETIDYSIVDSKLSVLRQYSINFLTTSIQS